MMTKICTHCKIKKSVAEFSKHSKMKDGLQLWCNACLKIYRDAHKNDQRVKDNSHKRGKKWHIEHIEIAHERNNRRLRERWANDPEYRKRKNEQKRQMRIRKYSTDPEWVEKYRSWNRGHTQHRRAIQAQVGGSHTQEEWKALCDKYDNRCLACGRKVKLTLDHVVPVTLGGSDDISNIQPLCGICNSRKNNQIIDYREMGGR